MGQPGVEPGAKAWEASMLPIHHWRCLKNRWRSRVSIPVPADCEPTALPSELHPLSVILHKNETDKIFALAQESKQKKKVPGGTRTPNPQIRSLMRYPLRHRDMLERLSPLAKNIDNSGI